MGKLSCKAARKTQKPTGFECSKMKTQKPNESDNDSYNDNYSYNYNGNDNESEREYSLFPSRPLPTGDEYCIFILPVVKCKKYSIPRNDQGGNYGP